jgi:hypothetical protein
VDLNINLEAKVPPLAEYNDDYQTSGRDSVSATIFSEDLLSLYTEGFILDILDNSQVQKHREVFKLEHVLRSMTHNLSAVVSDLKKSGGIQNSFKSQAATSSECLRQGIEGTLYQTITAGYLWDSKKSEYDKKAIKYPSSPTYWITPRPLHADNLLDQAQGWTLTRILVELLFETLGDFARILVLHAQPQGDLRNMIGGRRQPMHTAYPQELFGSWKRSTRQGSRQSKP